MIETFKKSDNHEFVQSLGKERDTEPGQPVFQGCHRVQNVRTNGTYLNDGTREPEPPPGALIFEPPPRDLFPAEWIYPTPAYKKIFIRTSFGGAAGSTPLGQAYLENWNTLRPDLFTNPDGTLSYFRIKYRVWGICPIVNPWMLNQPFLDTYEDYEIFQRPLRVHDYKPEAWLLWEHLLPVTQTITRNRFGGIPLNSVPVENAGQPAPNGIWKIDRIITWYGIWNRAAANTSPRAIASVPFVANGVYQEFDSIRGLNRRARLNWHEPNYTLANPSSPVIISNPFLNPGDNGSTVFGSAITPPELYSVAYGVCAVMLTYERWPTFGPIEIQHLEYSKISQVRDDA